MLGCGVLMFGAFGLMLIAHGLNLKDKVALGLGAMMILLAGGLAMVMWKRFSSQAGSMGMPHGGGMGMAQGGLMGEGGFAEAFGFGPAFQNVGGTLVDLAPAGATEITLLISEAKGNWRADITSGGQPVQLNDDLRRVLVELEKYCVQKSGKRPPLLRFVATRKDDGWSVSQRYE